MPDGSATLTIDLSAWWWLFAIGACLSFVGIVVAVRFVSER